MKRSQSRHRSRRRQHLLHRISAAVRYLEHVSLDQRTRNPLAFPMLQTKEVTSATVIATHQLRDGVAVMARSHPIARSDRAVRRHWLSVKY